MIKSRAIFKYATLLLILGFLSYFLYKLDFGLVKESFDKIGPAYLLVLLMSFLAYLLATIAWRFCFHNTSIGLSKLFRIRLMGEMLALINPTNVLAGDGLKFYLLTKENFGHKSDVASSVLVSRYLVGLSYVLLVIISLFYLIYSGWLDSLEFILWILLIPTALLFLIVSALLFSAGLRFYALIKRLSLLFNRWSFLKTILPSIKSLNLVSAKMYRDKKLKLIFAFICSLMHWLLGAAEIYFVLIVLNMDVGFMDAIFIESGVILFKAMAAFVPAQVGVEELSNKVLLAVVSTSNPVAWLILSLIRRLRFIFWFAIASILYFFKVDKPNLSVARN